MQAVSSWGPSASLPGGGGRQVTEHGLGTSDRQARSLQETAHSFTTHPAPQGPRPRLANKPLTMALTKLRNTQTQRFIKTINSSLSDQIRLQRQMTGK